MAQDRINKKKQRNRRADDLIHSRNGRARPLEQRAALEVEERLRTPHSVTKVSPRAVAYNTARMTLLNDMHYKRGTNLVVVSDRRGTRRSNGNYPIAFTPTEYRLLHNLYDFGKGVGLAPALLRYHDLAAQNGDQQDEIESTLQAIKGKLAAML
jgi:hypothetical protein